MSLDIQPIDPASPTFIGEVSGIDLSRKLTDQEVSAIHAAMDHFGVLVFHDQHLDDEQQISFSRQLGMLEEATGDIMSAKDRADRKSNHRRTIMAQVLGITGLQAEPA